MASPVAASKKCKRSNSTENLARSPTRIGVLGATRATAQFAPGSSVVTQVRLRDLLGNVVAAGAETTGEPVVGEQRQRAFPHADATLCGMKWNDDQR